MSGKGFIVNSCEYAPNIPELAPHASAFFDLRTLRDQGVPDRKGRTIPGQATHGQFHWSILMSGGETKLVGRADVFSRRAGRRSSYSCPDCCPDSWSYSYIDPGSLSVPLGDTNDIDVISGYQDCYQNIYETSANSLSAYWSIEQPSVTAVSNVSYGLARAQGNQDGGTGISGDFPEERFMFHADYCELEQPNANVAGQVQVGLSITADATDVAPTNAGGSNQTTIRIAAGPNTGVTLDLAAEANTGGHVNRSHSGTRPTGSLAAASGTTNGSGAFTTTYTSPVIGGKVKVTVHAGAQERSVTLTITVSGLQALGSGSYYTLIGSTGSHPSNHWGTSGANSGLAGAATDYHNQYTNPANLQYNDQSVENGGKFDLSNNWGDAGSHAEHRAGLNCDVDSTSVPGSRWTALTQIFANNGATYLDETGTANHWHLRF